MVGWDGMVRVTLDTNAVITLESPEEYDPALYQLVRLALEGQIEIRITEEIRSELQRGEDVARTSAMLKNVEKFPLLPVGPEPEQTNIADQLYALLFPSTPEGSAAEQTRRSDCVHLVAHLLDERDYFITNDLELIKRSSRSHVQSLFEIRALTAADFITQVYEARLKRKPPRLVLPSLHIRRYEPEDRVSIRRLLQPLQKDYPEFRQWLSSALDGTRGHMVKVADIEGEIIAVSISVHKDQASGGPVKLATFYVNPDFLRQGVGQHLLYHEIRSWVTAQVPKVYLTLPESKLDLLPFFEEYDFRVEGVSGRRYPQRSKPAEIVIARHFMYETIREQDLLQFAKRFARQMLLCDARKFGERCLRLRPRTPSDHWLYPISIPRLSLSWQVQPYDLVFELKRGDDGSLVRRWDTYDLETMFHPLIWFHPSRTGLVIPIQQRWAEALFEYQRAQLPLFYPEPTRLLLRTDNVYYRSPTYCDVLRRGTPILFYITGPGNKMVVAAALVKDVQYGPPGQVYLQYGDLGVLSPQEINGFAPKRGKRAGQVQAIRFGWLMPFDHLLNLQELKKLWPRFNPQGPHPIPYAKFLEICRKGGLTLGG